MQFPSFGLAEVGMRVYAETDDALFWRTDKEDLKT